MDMKTVEHRVMLGNEAIARGLAEYGCQFLTAYPGTPSSEILPALVEFKKELGLDQLYAEWSTNEKVALETALAAAYSGKRAAVAMKQVGLNVAADPALSAAYVGVKGGLLLIVADDPGLHSSQTEQDSRLFSLFSKLPALDPASPQEAKDMVALGYELSEKYQIPVLLRPTVRVCHSRQAISCHPANAVTRKANFEKNPGRWAATPRARLQMHDQLNRKLDAIEKEFERWPGNEATIPAALLDKRAALGVVAAGVSHVHLCDLLESLDLADRLPVLKLATAYPLPRTLVTSFAERCERILVLEETDSAAELQIRLSIPVLGRLSGHVPSFGELTPHVIEGVLIKTAREVGLAPRERGSERLREAVAALNLPVRRPSMCSGCGHRNTYYALRRFFPAALFPADIGCYTLGLNQGAVDTVLNMGASISMAAGFYHAYAQDGAAPQIISTIGDGTFFHSGAAGLENAVYNGARFVLLVLDNGTTGMTGGQPTPGLGTTADGHPGSKVQLDELIRGCGVKYIAKGDPSDFEGFRRVLGDALAYTRAEDGGVAVVITNYVCNTQVKGLGPGKQPQPVEVRRGEVPRLAGAQGALDPRWLPRYEDKISPCTEACPAGNDIERMMALVGEQKWEDAAAVLYEEHPFPSTLGRVCPHPCEAGCNRKTYDGALSINAIERTVGDRGGSAKDFVRKAPALGKAVAIVGGGPSGLAAAYHLARLGYSVEIFEAMPEVGGMLRWAIPEYRLPGRVLQRELEVFSALDVSIHTGVRLGEDQPWSVLDRFDAVYLATGAWQQHRLGIDGENCKGVFSALDFLKGARAGEERALGRRVAVIGGGNTAIDAARTARRMGAEVTVNYDHLVAIPEEVAAAQEEGVVFRNWVPLAIGTGAPGALRLKFREFIAQHSDADHLDEADSVLVAVGGTARLDFVRADVAQERGKAAVDAWGRTSDPRIFAGGDTSSRGSGTVVGAINAGKRAALAIDERLRGIQSTTRTIALGRGAGLAVAPAYAAASPWALLRANQAQSVPGPEEISLQFFPKVPRAESNHRPAEDSIWNFEEVNLGLNLKQAAAEARKRCFHCGVCTRCDICLNICPTGAISREGDGYKVDMAKCTGCRLCEAGCPRNAITMPSAGVCVACGYCTTRFECPSLVAGPGGFVDIDRRTCIDCGACIQVCAQGAIQPRSASAEETAQ